MAGLAVWTAACAGPDAGTTALDRLRDEGVARVGYANEAPYAYRDTATGQLTGEAPEIARVVLERMGIPQIEGVLTEFGALIPGLLAGRFDLIAAGMYITPERCAQVAFSNPTYSIGEAFIVPEGNPRDLHSYEDLRESPGATIGVVTGAIERSYARGVGIADERIVSFPDAMSAMAAVRAGRVNAYAATGLTVQMLLAKDGQELERAEPFSDPVIDGETVRGYGAVAFRREDTRLLEAFNQQLAGFLGTPEHLALVEPFGFTRRQLPGDVTARELCGDD